MFQSLSEYVCSHADKISDVETLKRYVELCKSDEKVSYEYSGVYAVEGHMQQDLIDLIEIPMHEWFEANGLDCSRFFAETTADSGWMFRNRPNTYAYLFYQLLLEVAKYQSIEIE